MIASEQPDDRTTPFEEIGYTTPEEAEHIRQSSARHLGASGIGAVRRYASPQVRDYESDRDSIPEQQPSGGASISHEAALQRIDSRTQAEINKSHRDLVNLGQGNIVASAKIRAYIDKRQKFRAVFGLSPYRAER